MDSHYKEIFKNKTHERKAIFSPPTEQHDDQKSNRAALSTEKKAIRIKNIIPLYPNDHDTNTSQVRINTNQSALYIDNIALKQNPESEEKAPKKLKL